MVVRFDFSSDFHCMTVIGEDTRTKKRYAFSKGAPEVIKDISIPNTVPGNFD